MSPFRNPSSVQTQKVQLNHTVDRCLLHFGDPKPCENCFELFFDRLRDARVDEVNLDVLVAVVISYNQIVSFI